MATSHQQKCTAPGCGSRAHWVILTPGGDRCPTCAEHVALVLTSTGHLCGVLESLSVASSHRVAA